MPAHTDASSGTATTTDRAETPIRVCLVAEKFFPDSRGGMELHAYELAEQLIEHGVEASAVTRFQLSSSPAEERVGRVRLTRLRPGGLLEGRAWRALLPNISALRSFFMWLVRHGQRYDVIVVHSTKFLLLPVLAAARLRGCKCVVKVDTLRHLQQAVSQESLASMRLPGLSLLARLWASVRAALLRRADAVVAITAEMRTVLQEMGVPTERIHLIPNGIDTRRFAPVSAEQRRALRARLGLPAGRIVVVYSGRLAISKGVLDLAMAWQSVVRARPHAQLLLLGAGSHSGDDCERQLRERVAATRLTGSVTFAGEVANVHEYLQAADLFVMPSHSEGFCLAVVEAMACGLPVIATRTGVAPELIVSGENGTLVPARQPDSLAAALVAVLDHPERWADFGMRLRAAVEARFAMPRIARAYEALFDSLHCEGRLAQRVLPASARSPAVADAALSAARRRIGGNAAGLIACRITADLLGLGLFIAVSRLLGPVGTGAYSYGFAVATFAYVIGGLGIDEYGIREFLRVPAGQRHRFLGALLGAQLLTLLAVLAALIGFLFATGASVQTVAIVGALSVYQFASAVARCLFVPAIAHQAMLGPALAELSCRGSAILIAVAALLFGRASLTVALAGFAAGGLALLAVATASLRRHLGPVRPCFSLASLIVAFGALAPFAAGELMVQTFNRIGLVTLSLTHGEAATGLYAAALKLVEVACLPLAFVGAAAYPRLSVLAVSDRQRFLQLSQAFWSVAILACGIVPWGLHFLAPAVIDGALGARFAAAEPVLLEMTGLALLLLLEVPLVRLILAADLQKERLVAITAGCAVAVPLNLWLVPEMGISGAVVSFTAALLLVDALYAIALYRRLESRAVMPMLLVLAGGLAGATAIHWAAARLGWPPAATGAATLGGFLLIAITLLRAFSGQPAVAAGDRARAAARG